MSVISTVSPSIRLANFSDRSITPFERTGALFFGGTLEWSREASLRRPCPSGPRCDCFFLGLGLRRHQGRPEGVRAGRGGARAPARGRRCASAVRGRDRDAAAGSERSADGLPGRVSRVRRLPRGIEFWGDHGQRRGGGGVDSHRSRLHRVVGEGLFRGEAKVVGLGRDGGELCGGGPDLPGRRRGIRPGPGGVPDPALRRLRERVLRLSEAVPGEVRSAALYYLHDLLRYALYAPLPAWALFAEPDGPRRDEPRSGLSWPLSDRPRVRYVRLRHVAHGRLDRRQLPLPDPGPGVPDRVGLARRGPHAPLRPRWPPGPGGRRAREPAGAQERPVVESRTNKERGERKGGKDQHSAP